MRRDAVIESLSLRATMPIDDPRWRERAASADVETDLF